MSPATVADDSDFWVRGNLREIVLVRGVDASSCASLDKQRVDRFLSKCCLVFV